MKNNTGMSRGAQIIVGFLVGVFVLSLWADVLAAGLNNQLGAGIVIGLVPLQCIISPILLLVLAAWIGEQIGKRKGVR